MSSLDDPERIENNSKDKNIEQIPISITVHAAENDENVDNHKYDKIGHQDQQNKNTKNGYQATVENEVKPQVKVHNLKDTGIYYPFNTNYNIQLRNRSLLIIFYEIYIFLGEADN
jgi:hypothetical protein